MSTRSTAPRRVAVGGRDRNIYRRYDDKFEVGYRDSTGKQRWKGPFGTISAARAARDSVLGSKARGERIQPSPRLTFGEAAQRWLQEQVVDLRPATQAGYASIVKSHLEPRWDGRRLDAITVDECARLVRELRTAGKSEATIVAVLRCANRVFKFAARRMGWAGSSPIAALDKSERPQVRRERKRIFSDDEIRATIAAAGEAWRPLFLMAATTGARISEVLALTWSDLHLDDPDGPWVAIEWQVDRSGRRVRLKTEHSRREVPVTSALAHALRAHRLQALNGGAGDFVFSTRSGRAISQRNVLRELRRAMTSAVDRSGEPAFPALHTFDATGRRVRPPRGSVPTFHSFRHTVASRAIEADDRESEIAWMLGHAHANVTRAVYIHEIRDAESKRRRRDKAEERFGRLGIGSSQAA